MFNSDIRILLATASSQGEDKNRGYNLSFCLNLPAPPRSFLPWRRPDRPRPILSCSASATLLVFV